MNKVSFLDELVSLGGVTHMLKRSDDAGASGDAHPGLVGSGATPDSILVRPDEAGTRLPRTGHLPSSMVPGRLGGITQAKDPVDRLRFNRAYRERG